MHTTARWCRQTHRLAQEGACIGRAAVASAALPRRRKNPPRAPDVSQTALASTGWVDTAHCKEANAFSGVDFSTHDAWREDGGGLPGAGLPFPRPPDPSPRSSSIEAAHSLNGLALSLTLLHGTSSTARATGPSTSAHRMCRGKSEVVCRGPGFHSRRSQIPLRSPAAWNANSERSHAVAGWTLHTTARWCRRTHRQAQEGVREGVSHVPPSTGGRLVPG